MSPHTGSLSNQAMEQVSQLPSRSPWRLLAAWCVHLYTALGLVCAAGIAVLICLGNESGYRWSFVLMLAATVIDATDGTLARWVRVKEVVPSFDGRRLDDLIDFLTYTFLPLLLIWRAELLPAHLQPVLLVPLLASAYGFSQADAKTEDGYFLGFPSYWNVVAFYLYVLRPPPLVSTSVLIMLALLTFLPWRYLYPSQGGLLNRVTVLLAVGWTGLLLWVLLCLPAGRLDLQDVEEPTWWWVALLSSCFPAYYLAASWTVTARGFMRARSEVRRENGEDGSLAPKT